MDRNTAHLEYRLYESAHQRTAPVASLVYGLVILYLLLLYFKYPLPAPQRLAWDALVYIIPQRLLLHPTQRQELKATSSAHAHAAKSEALRGMLGLGSATLLSKLPAGASEGLNVMRRASTTMFSRTPPAPPQSDSPPGLGNWDNSCYQNVVLQGLASLESLRPYLARLRFAEEGQERTSDVLRDTIGRLNDPVNNGQQLWTPGKLKNMSSWQQQDAQEYYSKILDEIDKEVSAAGKATLAMRQPGLESLSQQRDLSSDDIKSGVDPESIRSPLDGLLAQKVACTRCGFSEGLSMIPFNCLTLPLPVGSNITNIQECLDEYTKLEEITEVECAKCTLVRAEQQLTKMLPANPGFQSTDATPAPETGSEVLKLPPELRVQAFKRLAAVQKALDSDDFADKTLEETCQIGKKARVSSTKTREAVVARPPQCLIVHVNRSVFDEQTGIQRKNYARVRYPLVLDIDPWMLDEAGEVEEGESSQDEGLLYRLKAVVTHYGRHENGHYICYRQHPTRRKQHDEMEDDTDIDNENLLSSAKDPWYRLSDEDVSLVEEQDVLDQGGVFMLFYERGLVPETMPLGEKFTFVGNGVPDAADFSHQERPNEAAVIAAASPPISAPADADVEEASAPPPSGLQSDALESSPPVEQPLAEEGVGAERDPPEHVSQEQDELRKSSSASPLRMRTARVPGIENEFGGSTFRAMAAT